MSAMNSEKFELICDGVWSDRANILTVRDDLRGEAALVRAVYWRLCKAGGTPGRSVDVCDTGQMLLIYQRLVGSVITECAHPQFDSAPSLKKLVRLYLHEAGQSN
jgi:hypothetical protein